MADYIYQRADGGTTHCYGDVNDISNFDVVCANEWYDGTVADYDGPATWYSVCKYLERVYRKDIEQIEAV